jgi:hypothetical protein
VKTATSSGDRDRADESHLDAVGLPARGALRRLARPPQTREDVAGLGAEGVARRSQGDAALVAFEKDDPQLFLERADVSRERRLGEVEPLGRAGEGHLFSHGEETLEFAQGIFGHTEKVSQAI